MRTLDRTKYMSREEARRLREVTQAWGNTDLERGRRQGVIAWAVVDTVMLTGLRVSELARLTIDDLDDRRKLLTVRRSKRKAIAAESLAIPPELARHLRQFINWKRCYTDEPTEEGSPLFCGQRGAMTVKGLQKVFKSAVQRAGLPDSLSIHSARHTLGVELLNRTRDLRQVQKQLGHARIDTTTIYADVTEERMRNGVKGIYDGDD